MSSYLFFVIIKSKSKTLEVVGGDYITPKITHFYIYVFFATL